MIILFRDENVPAAENNASKLTEDFNPVGGDDVDDPVKYESDEIEFQEKEVGIIQPGDEEDEEHEKDQNEQQESREDQNQEPEVNNKVVEEIKPIETPLTTPQKDEEDGLKEGLNYSQTLELRRSEANENKTNTPKPLKPEDNDFKQTILSLQNKQEEPEQTIPMPNRNDLFSSPIKTTIPKLRLQDLNSQRASQNVKEKSPTPSKLIKEIFSSYKKSARKPKNKEERPKKNPLKQRIRGKNSDLRPDVTTQKKSSTLLRKESRGRARPRNNGSHKEDSTSPQDDPIETSIKKNPFRKLTLPEFDKFAGPRLSTAHGTKSKTSFMAFEYIDDTKNYNFTQGIRGSAWDKKSPQPSPRQLNRTRSFRNPPQGNYLEVKKYTRYQRNLSSNRSKKATVLNEIKEGDDLNQGRTILRQRSIERRAPKSARLHHNSRTRLTLVGTTNKVVIDGSLSGSKSHSRLLPVLASNGSLSSRTLGARRNADTLFLNTYDPK